MLYYIDGDNNKKNSLDGIEKLSKLDTVIIYYNDKNGSYNSKNQIKIQNRYMNTNIKFKKIKCCSQSVDYAIMKDAVKYCGDDLLWLVSGDKHFKTMEVILDNKNINCVETINDTIISSLLFIDDVTSYVEFIQNNYSEELANRFITNLLKMAFEINNGIKNIKN